VLVSGKNTASKLILRVVPDAELRLDAYLPPFAGFFANVGEARSEVSLDSFNKPQILKTESVGTCQVLLPRNCAKSAWHLA
jgi:hypothetical protein